MGHVKPGFGSKPPKGTRLDGDFDLGALQRCDLMRNGGGPTKGHCPWCDKQLTRRERERVIDK